MFGEGHTAKSIAAATDASVHSVNERLREARRKTGIGSSRELARLLRAAGRAQENRDDPIEVAEGAMMPPDRGHVPPRRNSTVMIAIALVSAAALAGVFVSQQGASPVAAPRVVATVPAAGDRVPAGPATIRVTFDRPMRSNSYSFVQLDAATYPECGGKPRQSGDGRSFELDCRLAPHRAYAIGFNRARYRNFVSRQGIAAEPAILRFSTR